MLHTARIKDPDEERLLRRMGYPFRDIALFQLALTHRSRGASNNERLEFLGDALLNTIVAEALFEHFPTAREGELSRLRAQLVNGETLAEIARELEMGDCLNLGEGELKSGGFRRASILADAVEAMVAAIYLDSDFATCREHLLSWYGDRLREVRVEASGKDSKSALQEYLQACNQPLPDYQLQDVSGAAHEQTFTVACRVKPLAEAVVASGGSRREAEKRAAARTLEQLQSRVQQ